MEDELRKRRTSFGEPRGRSLQDDSYRLYHCVRNRGEVLRRIVAIRVENQTGISTVVVIVTVVKCRPLQVRLKTDIPKELLRRA